MNKELLDLLNGNYEEFLSLGANLNGGEEKVEGVRVGLLGFKREIEGIKNVVAERQNEIRRLLEEKSEFRRDVVLGRALLEVDASIGELEDGLGIRVGEGDEQNGDEGEDEVEENGDVTVGYGTTAPIGRLRRQTRQYLLLARAIDRVGPEHPFVVAQRSRVHEVRKTLLLDLASALRQVKRERATDAVLAVVAMYSELGAERDSIRVLKGAG